MIARRNITACLLIAIGACGGGDDGGEAGSTFVELVDMVPASALSGAEAVPVLQYVDMELVWERLGVGEDPGERLDALGRTAMVETYSMAPMLFGANAAQVDEARSEIGFDVTAIEQELALDQPPSELRIVRTSASPSEIEDAIESDPLWSEDLEEVETDGGSYFDWTVGDDLAIDPRRRTPMRPLGTGGQVAVESAGDGPLVVRTEEAALMEAVLALSGGDSDEASLAEEGPFAPAIDVLGDGSLLQAFGVVGRLRLTPEHVDLDPRQFEEVLADYPLIATYEAILVTELVTDGDARTEVLIVHRGDDAAAANVAPIENQLTEGTSLSTQQPLAELFPDPQVEQDGPVVRITFEGTGNFRRPLQGILARDVFLTD